MDDKQKKSKLSVSDSEVQITEESAAERLNDDCLIHIFEYLLIADRIRLERVSKSWRRASLNSWHTFKTLSLGNEEWGDFKPQKIFNDSLEKVMTRCGKYLTRIIMSRRDDSLKSGVVSYQNDISMKILKHCPNLAVLDLRVMTLSRADLRHMMNYCGNISELTIYALAKDVQETDLMNTVFARCGKLRVLRLVYNKILTGRFLESLSAESLQELYFIDYSCLNLQLTLKLLPKFSSLSKLFLSGGAHSEKDIPNSFKIDSVEELHISACVDDEFVRKLICGFPNLLTITISIYQFTDYGLMALKQLPKLECLSIQYGYSITDEGLANFSNLRKLICNKCYEIRDNGIIRMLSLSENIELLDLRNTRVSGKVVEAAISTLRLRTNRIPLKMILKDTNVEKVEVPEDIASILDIEL